LGNSLAPFRFLTPFSIRSFILLYEIASSLHSSQRSAQATRRPTMSGTLAWRGLYGEKTVREAERAWFLSEGEESEALIRVAFGSLGQKQRVLESYSLSLSSMVAAAISLNACPEHRN
jgi:hypothetical protein